MLSMIQPDQLSRFDPAQMQGAGGTHTNFYPNHLANSNGQEMNDLRMNGMHNSEQRPATPQSRKRSTNLVTRLRK